MKKDDLKKEMLKKARKAGKKYGSKAMSSGKTGASVDPGYTPKTAVKANYADKNPANKTSTAYSGATKRTSLKEQVAKLKKSGTGSERFKEMAEKARKDMMEKRRKEMEERRKKAAQRGSRKPGSMY